VVSEARRKIEPLHVEQESARLRLDKAEAVLDQETTVEEFYRLCPSVRERTRTQEQRAWDKYRAAYQVHSDAVDALNAQCDAVLHECELLERMERRVARRPRCLTPFKWGGFMG